MKHIPLAAIAALALPASALAAPQIKEPGCGALAAWGARVNAENYNVAPRLQLPKALEDTQVIPLFGASVLAWTQEDLQSANQILTKCWNEARARRDGTAVNEFANANRALQGLVPRVNAILHKAKADAEPLEKKLAELPDSPQLDRGLAALLKINPAQPDIGPMRTLPPEIADPLVRLATQVLPVLENGERGTLFKSLGERHAKMQAGIAAAAEKSVAAAAEDADGAIALIAVRRQIAEVDDAKARAQLLKAADDKAQKVRGALRQAKPAVWVPPNCLDLYRWSSAPNAGAGVNVGDRGAIQTAFTDQRIVPVFGIALGDWTDQDLARFKALRTACSAEWQAEAADPANAGAKASEFVQLGQRGRWIDGADRSVNDARTLLAANHKGEQALSAAIAKVKALPDEASSLDALRQLSTDPSLAAMSGADRTQLMNAVNGKLAAIGAKAANAAVKGLDDIKVASYADLDKLWAYGGKAVQGIPDPRGRQMFVDALTHRLQEAAQGLRAAAKTQTGAKPASLASVAEANMKLIQLGAASPQTFSMPVFQAYYRALQAGRDEMAASARAQMCADYVSSIGASGDAKQEVWNGRAAMTLGEFLCDAAEHGTVNSYSGSGLFSSTTTVKITPLNSQILTVLMHKVEVQAGHPMLVGYEVKDAAQASGQAPAATGKPGYSITPNGPITVEGWEMFLGNIIGFNGGEDQACMKIINDPAPDKLPVATKVFYLNCWTMQSVRDHIAARQASR